MIFISYAQMVRDAKKFSDQLPDYDAYVGISRSGICPANIMALHKNKMFGTVKELLSGEFSGGWRCKIQKPERILVIDDSYLSGRSLQQVRDQFKHRQDIEYACLYMKPKASDIRYFRLVDIPRIFEWNVFHSYWGQRACWDLDGVICYERPDDDYSQCVPYNLPTTRIHSIVTARLEKHRAVTEEWLKKHNVQYNHLHMINVETPRERRRKKLHIPHKVKHFDGPLFIESSEWQAKGIAQVSGKPVLCTDNMILY